MSGDIKLIIKENNESFTFIVPVGSYNKELLLTKEYNYGNSKKSIEAYIEKCKNYNQTNLNNSKAPKDYGLVIMDFDNHFLYLQATPKELNNFIKSAIIVWNRNKALCLYR